FVAFLFFARDWRKKFLDLSNLATRKHYRRALFNSDCVVEINLVGHKRPEQPRSAKQNKNERDHRDRPDHEQPGHNFISLYLHLGCLSEWDLWWSRSRTERPSEFWVV